MSYETAEVIRITIEILKGMLIGYIITSVLVAIGMCKVYKNIPDMACIYGLINRMNFSKAVCKPSFLLSGLTYAIVYTVAAIRLRLQFGRNYKNIVLNVFDLCIELSKYGTDNFEEAVNMHMKELERKEQEENEKE